MGKGELVEWRKECWNEVNMGVVEVLLTLYGNGFERKNALVFGNNVSTSKEVY